MLRWRLFLGTLIVAGLIGLCWLDHTAELAGAWLFPLAAALTLLATGEMLHLARCGGLRPLPWTVYVGNLAIVTASWLAPVVGSLGQTASVDASFNPAAWPGLVFGLAVLLVFIGEILRYETPGGITANLATEILCLAYVGVLMGVVVQLRMVHGLGALAALVVIVKLNDTGAYTVGRILGRHKLAPRLSPGKTVEGAVGGLIFSCIGAWALLGPHALGDVRYPSILARWLLFAVVVGGAGTIGDLAESLIKRDVRQKDSSQWLPGFGGVLDIMDSILLAAPVAYLCWDAFGPGG